MGLGLEELRRGFRPRLGFAPISISAWWHGGYRLEMGLGLPISAWAGRSWPRGGLFADFDFDLVILDDF